jgi:hypothetical protein
MRCGANEPFKCCTGQPRKQRIHELCNHLPTLTLTFNSTFYQHDKGTLDMLDIRDIHRQTDTHLLSCTQHETHEVSATRTTLALSVLFIYSLSFITLLLDLPFSLARFRSLSQPRTHHNDVVIDSIQFKKSI